MDDAKAGHARAASPSQPTEARPVALRNVARYVVDVDANVPLYEALGFRLVHRMRDMAVMEHEAGLKLVLHAWSERKTSFLDTAIGFTMTGSVAQARGYLEKAGFRLLRAPEEGDAGFFFIYGDLDGNPVNLVGAPKRPA